MTKSIKEKIYLINKHIITLEQSENKDTFSTKLMIKSLSAEVLQLTDQLTEYRNLRGCEILEARVKGSKATFGKMPLRLVNSTLTTIYNALINASSRINYGIEKRRKPKEIDNIIQYSMGAYTGGSTRFYFTANAPQADIFNENLADMTLNSIFETLSTDSVESLMEKYENIGIKSLKNFHDLFSMMINNGLSIDFSWTDEEGINHKWESNNDILVSWKNRIEQIKTQKLSPLKITGIISMVSLYNKIDIITKDGINIKAIYPVSLFEEVRKHTVGSSVTAYFLRNKVINIARGTERTNYFLDCFIDNDDE